jgi:hypothetical protein
MEIKDEQPNSTTEQNEQENDDKIIEIKPENKQEELIVA